MFISAIQELSFHRKTGVTLKWRTRFLLCVEQCSKDSILLMCVECIPALYPYGNSWVVGKALWHIKTRHHQDFHLDDAWFMFSNPVRQMPYISNFRGLLFYDHPSKSPRGFSYPLIHQRSAAALRRATGRPYSLSHPNRKPLCAVLTPLRPIPHPPVKARKKAARFFGRLAFWRNYLSCTRSRIESVTESCTLCAE